MKTSWIQRRQTKFGAYVAVYVLVVLAILGAGNYLADRYNKTFDSTTNKIFSLSDQTKKIVSNLKEDVKIYYFDRTAQMNESRLGPSPRDLLGRYDSLSPKLSVEFVDPVKNPKAALDMKVAAAGTAIIEVAGRREEVKSLSEEQVTNAMIRALKKDKRTACFVQGHGEHDIESTEPSGFSGAKESLESTNVATQSISLLSKDAQVPAECTVLVLGGPRNDLIEVEIQAIRKFVEEGGRALFLLDPPTKGVNNGALVTLLNGWGVSVNKDIVVDLSGIGQFFGADELSPLVTKYEPHAIGAGMSNVACLFPLARSVEPGGTNDKVRVEKLFSTTEKSFGVTDLASTQLKVDPKKDKAGPMSLAVAGTVTTGQEGAQGRFIAAGSSRFITNSTLGFPGGNRDLFLNMMSWLSSDEDLISIRPKDPEDRRLTLSAAQMKQILYTSVFAFPVIIIAGGTWVWWRRR